MTFSSASVSPAIGLFDSGVGGLSVLREVRALLPHARLIYVADSAHIPYGAKASEFIQQRSLQISEFLVAQGAAVLVVACNTATAAAVHLLRTRFSIPVVGMEPGVKPALAATRSGVIGVLATAGTLASQKFATLIGQHAGGAEIAVQACIGWVEQVERGDVDSVHTRALVQRHVAPLLTRGADTLVLGCTHYAFLAPLIREIAGPTVTLVDTGMAVAREVKRRWGSERHASAGATEEFWTSGDPVAVKNVMDDVLGCDLRVRQLPIDYINLR